VYDAAGLDVGMNPDDPDGGGGGMPDGAKPPKDGAVEMRLQMRQDALNTALFDQQLYATQSRWRRLRVRRAYGCRHPME